MPIRMPTKNNPVIITLYGQMCLASKSYQSAICKFADYSEELLVTIFSVYLLHAYDYCPEDPVVCLSLAIASLGRAMQRQSDNRHHMIAQVNILYFLLVQISHNWHELGDGFLVSISKNSEVVW
jgi:general transcription factor 3C polypeptide 3 (transcription factor C subunit 4)